MLLQFLRELLPENFCLPSTFQDCMFIIKDLGFSYEKVHACPNDCILFRKEYENEDTCPKCHSSRYKKMKVNNSRRKVPHLRHPADSLARKTFDSLQPNFALDPRNVRLGLASDGFNAYKNIGNQHNVWPVVLMTYNLAPWDCMKQPYLMLPLLIPGLSSPKSSIDVYLEPLIDELKKLWEKGFETYDAYSKELFQAHVALLWIVSDFPAYVMLLGWSISGKFACPVCNYHTCSMYLKNSKKMCYMGHRRFLDSKHRWLKYKKCFDGTQELGVAPMPLIGSDILEILGDRKNVFGNNQKRKREKGDPWRKKGIFFELPYWETNLNRHNLDVMHIEKNMCENLVATLLNIKGKSKDNLQARLDLVEMGIRE
uniref:Transposase-associated domain-containing protein n=1 Tax=Cajanus cajan TaxID=3821 RepID=A0A151UHF0_CAJCA